MTCVKGALFPNAKQQKTCEMQKGLSKFITICSEMEILQISTREKAIWSPVSIVPNQPRETSSHAR